MFIIERVMYKKKVQKSSVGYWYQIPYTITGISSNVNSTQTLGRKTYHGSNRSTQTHRAPPECISVRRKLLIHVLLYKVDKEGGEDEHQKADVPGSHKLLENSRRESKASSCLALTL